MPVITQGARERLLEELRRCRDELDAMESWIAAAHLDRAIEAFGRERQQGKNTSTMD